MHSPLSESQKHGATSCFTSSLTLALSLRVFCQARVPTDKRSHVHHCCCERFSSPASARRASIATLNLSIKQNTDMVLASLHPKPLKRAFDPHNQRKRHKVEEDAQPKKPKTCVLCLAKKSEKQKPDVQSVIAPFARITQYSCTLTVLNNDFFISFTVANFPFSVTWQHIILFVCIKDVKCAIKLSILPLYLL